MSTVTGTLLHEDKRRCTTTVVDITSRDTVYVVWLCCAIYLLSSANRVKYFKEMAVATCSPAQSGATRNRNGIEQIPRVVCGGSTVNGASIIIAVSLVFSPDSL